MERFELQSLGRERDLLQQNGRQTTQWLARCDFRRGFFLCRPAADDCNGDAAFRFWYRAHYRVTDVPCHQRDRIDTSSVGDRMALWPYFRVAALCCVGCIV